MSKKLTIEEMSQLAEKRGGKCLSKTYVNSHTKLKWQCAKGHEWEAIPHHVKRGHWCSKCAASEIGKSQRLTIEEMRYLAAKRGGKCLSKTYVNSGTKLKWQCKEGHKWEARPYSIKQGHWCSKCADFESGKSRRLTIDEMRQIAEKRGGKCLSKTYGKGKEGQIFTLDICPQFIMNLIIFFLPFRFASGIPRISSISSAYGGIVQLTNITTLCL
ncbi:MAG: hypothetical protein JW976_02035 [Syntrophaceae bacterium]|nr:hypothetical protein [Syntrophaceae bacterium]